MMIRVVRAHNDKGKETHRKALNRKVREGSAKIAKKRTGQDFLFSSLLKQAVSLERMAKIICTDDCA
jgi:hypothetical protein